MPKFDGFSTLFPIVYGFLIDQTIALLFTLVKNKDFWYDTSMEKKILNYRVVITPDQRTGTGKPCYTAYVPLLGIATDGDTIEEAFLHFLKEKS